jgi:hypothetical protein
MASSCTTTNNCPPGYTGSDCNIAFNAKYVGTYACTQTGPVTGTTNYTVILNPDASILFQFKLSNLGNLGFTEQVTPIIYNNDPNQFSMVKQALGTSGFEVEITHGISNNNGNQISADYSIYSGATLIESRQIVLTK